ncbi:MAG: aminotransferase class I/II-fold pyridoxal phosphate-dependent enzyme, partial [Phycisphaerales bacterium]|nr:aminotransferase class I/II-fold pyridoxal phosphate-dependent enzyme [Phycisphaerales bacterium]
DVIHGDALDGWVRLSRESGCALIFDEFYSHYIYDDAARHGVANSAAAHVDDVNADPVLILDGLTKSWRYPGLRLSWTLGPADVIQAITSAASFLDGGAPHAVQATAVALLSPAIADAEARSIQAEFARKRRYMIDRIREIGFVLDFEPPGGFYCFASLENLPPHLRDGMDFFYEALNYKTITVPGRFFDVNPGQRRSNIASRMNGFVRLSYGPSMADLEKGLDRLARLCATT